MSFATVPLRVRIRAAGYAPVFTPDAVPRPQIGAAISRLLRVVTLSREPLSSVERQRTPSA